jgi:hypothetical protein
MIKFYPNHICIITCSVNFFLAKGLFAECQAVLRIPLWCYNFCITSCSTNEEENENLQCFWLLVIQ